MTEMELKAHTLLAIRHTLFVFTVVTWGCGFLMP